MSQHLYRHFDKDGNLLYVGISINAFQRLSQHKNSSSWFDEITRVEIERYPSRSAVEAAEKKAIIDEKPIHNKRFNGDNPTECVIVHEYEKKKRDREEYDYKKDAYICALNLGNSPLENWLDIWITENGHFVMDENNDDLDPEYHYFLQLDPYKPERLCMYILSHIKEAKHKLLASEYADSQIGERSDKYEEYYGSQEEFEQFLYKNVNKWTGGNYESK